MRQILKVNKAELIKNVGKESRGCGSQSASGAITGKTISVLTVFCGAVLVFGTQGCSTSTVSSVASAVSSATVSSLIPSLALTSPSLSSSGTSSARVDINGRLLEDSNVYTHSATTVTGANDLKPLSAAKTELSDILAKSTDTDCFSGIKFQSFSKTISCYGPNLVYTNHPNSGGGGGAGGGGTDPNCPTGASCLPGGDLGLWSASEGSASEACSAAQMNALVGDVAAYVNNGIKLVAGMACLLKVKGLELPASAATVTLTTEMQTAISGSTISLAKISREAADSSGSPIYSIEVAGTIDAKAVNLVLRHSPATTGDFKGKFRGTIGAGASTSKAFSVTYEQSSSSLRFVSHSAEIPTSSVSTATLFSSTGDFQFATFVSAGGSNARYLIGNVDKDTGLGAVKFAWQAGANDKKARVLHVKTSTSSGTDSGFAYFGFGPNLSSTTLGDIGGMCCNWAGPGANCGVDSTTYNTTKVQSQVITRNSSGVFVATTNKITYAPTNSCDHTPATTFKYGTTTEWGTSGSSITAADVTNNLDTYGGSGSIGTLTSPAEL